VDRHWGQLEDQAFLNFFLFTIYFGILAFQLLFTSFAYPGFTFFGNLRFNLYTAPAFLACAMNLFGAIILHFLFKEQYAGLEEVKIPQIVVEKGGEREESIAKELVKKLKKIIIFKFIGNSIGSTKIAPI
jgi:hypothetical protein